MVNFHAIFYSDFDFSDLNYSVLRINMLKLINGMLDENGMLVDSDKPSEIFELPQLVLFPYCEKLELVNNNLEKSIDIHLRKNKNRTVSIS